MRTLYIGCVALLAWGCGSSSSDGSGGAGAGGSGVGGSGAASGSGGAAAGGTAAGGSAGASGSGGAAGSGGTAGGSGGAGGTGGGSGSGGSAGFNGIEAPQPPAGSSKCGSGTFTAQEATAACQATPTLGSIHPSFPQQCSLATSNGGLWEAWCDSSGLAYFWVRFNQLAAAATCSLSLDAGFSSAEYTWPGSGSSGELYEAKPAGTASGINSVAQDVGYHFDVSNVGGPGSANIWLAASGYCGTAPNTKETKATFLGLSFKWSG